MAYQVLYRKYRPQKFSDLTGQEITVKILQSALAQNRIASAYLFSGPRGTGKTTTARIFAKALNCHSKDGNQLSVIGDRSKSLLITDHRSPITNIEPCNECASCKEIVQGSSLDVLELDAASHTQVDKIREVIIDTVAFAPARDRYKIFIIDEVHMLSNHSFNALLKTLEEPPQHVVFVLCTTEFHKIPATIFSRCQRYRFLPMTQKELTSALNKVAEKEELSIAPEALAQIARAANGSMRDALSLLDQVISNFRQQGNRESGKIELELVQETLGIVREEWVREIILKIAQCEAHGVLNCIEQVLRDGTDLAYFVKELRESFRQMLIAKCGAGEEEIETNKTLPVAQMSLQQILRSIQLLNKCADQMRWSDFPRLVFECYAVWLCQQTLDVETILKKIEGKGSVDSNPVEGNQLNNFSAAEGKSTASFPAAIETREESPSPIRLSRETSQIGIKTIPELSGTDPTKEFSHSQAQSRTIATEIFPETQSSVHTEREPNWDADRWKAVLGSIQQLKPSLFYPLQTARVVFSNDKVQLSFSKPFWLENVKRNIIFLEETFAKVLNCRLPIELALFTKPDTAIEINPVQISQSPENSARPNFAEKNLEGSVPSESWAGEEELFEVVGSSEEKREALSEKSVEDEGLKILLQSFPGDLVPLAQKPQG